MKFEEKLLLPALLVCVIAAVNAQVKCNDISISVAGGWCKDQTVFCRGCFDATKSDSDETCSAASFIALNQAKFWTVRLEYHVLGSGFSFVLSIRRQTKERGLHRRQQRVQDRNSRVRRKRWCLLSRFACKGFAQSYLPCCLDYPSWIQFVHCQDVTSKSFHCLQLYTRIIPRICSSPSSYAQNVCRPMPTGGGMMMRTMSTMGFSSISISVFVAIVSMKYSMQRL